MNLTDLPLEIIGEIASADPRAYHALVLAYPRFARGLTLGDRLDFAEEFGYDCRVEIRYNESRIAWHLNGKLHRTDGPALEYECGDKEWYVDDKQHRMGGPAVEWADGQKEWYVNGELHRIDGPAIERASGGKSWHINGTRMSETVFMKIRGL